MADSTIEDFRSNHAVQAKKFRQIAGNRFLFNLFMLGNLPMGRMAGLRVMELNEENCAIAVPYKWLNKNPFRSTYFAVLAMAAEMSTGMLAMMHSYKARPSVSMLVTGMEAEFVKKATGTTVFSCPNGKELLRSIEDCIISGEGKVQRCVAVGRSASGEEVARFAITWSFKARSK